jgi:hypothetical protein
VTYVEYSSTVRGTLPYFSMKNRANQVVTPSTSSVQAAMTDYTAAVKDGNSALKQRVSLDWPGLPSH